MAEQMGGDAGGDVARGTDGWLFLVGGSNRVLGYYTDPAAFDDAALAQWVALLGSRARAAMALGARYLHLMVPEKLTTYHDRYPGPLPLRLSSPAHRLPHAVADAGLGEHLLDLVADFAAHRDAAPLFYRTDTHWTYDGCLRAFTALCRRLGAAVPAAIDRGTRRRGMLRLDLGARMDPPMEEEFVLVDFVTGAVRESANALVTYKEAARRENDAGLHVGSAVVFRNDTAADERRVVLFGDSFSEYRPHLLTGMLAETFREVHFVWSTSIDWRYVARVRPDLLLTEAAERFAAQVPDDRFDLDAHVAAILGALPAA